MNYLEELSNLTGVSGQEDAVRAAILKAIDGHVSDIRIDPMGSITALKKGSGKSGLRVMLDAHMDEIGFMVSGFDNGGLIRFVNIGGIDDRILPGLRVKIGKDAVPGVIMWTPIHHSHGQRDTVKLKDLRIDIGADSKEALNGKVKLGDRIVFDTTFTEISDKVVRGKAFDDRVGCSLLIDVLQGGPYPVDVWVAFTTQEEVGLRGAKVAAQTLNPDVAFALEGTPAGDIPNVLADADDETGSNPACRLGDGPVLTVMDARMIVDPRLLGFLRETARVDTIPYQIKSVTGGGTDGGAIHLANAGIPTAVISVPCRYIHSPMAYLNRDDYANALRLVQAALNRITPDLLKPE